MTLKRKMAAAAMVLAVGLPVIPAHADQRHRGRSSGRVVVVRPEAVRPYRVWASPYRYERPYYSFRPRFSIGVGIWAGFPVPYPAWGYRAPYPYPPVYGYPMPYPVPYPAPPAGYPPASSYPAPGYPLPPHSPGGSSIAVNPGAPSYGGLSFEVTPSDAGVFVDGGFAGAVSDFDPNRQPLTLAPGVHRIELRAPGHTPMLFDVTIAPGQVFPYQGTLQPGP